MNWKTIVAATVVLVAGTYAWSQGCCGPKAPETSAQTKTVKGVQKAKVTIVDGGYKPSTINAKAGKTLVITFTRNEKSTCGEEVVFPSLGIRKKVPNGKSVTIKFTPKKAGTIAFTCGMNMYKGKVVVK